MDKKVNKLNETNEGTREWTTQWPTEPGDYWFYGYRYQRDILDTDRKPALILIEVIKVRNSIATIGNGEFMFENETVHAHFSPFTPPSLPEIDVTGPHD